MFRRFSSPPNSACSTERSRSGPIRYSCGSPATGRPRFRKSGEIRHFQSHNLESAFHKKGRHVPSEMQAFKQPMRCGFPPFLPPAHRRFKRQCQFQENQFSFRSQHAPHSSERGKSVGNRPKRKCRYDGVHGCIPQRDSFPRQLKILDG